MSSFLERVRTWRARRRRAKRFGIPFVRSRSVRLPKTFICQGKRFELKLLDEPEFDHEGLHMLLGDAYGLEYLRNVRTVLDIGANHGFFALAVRGWFPNAVIHGHEPNPAIQDIFTSNYRTLGGVRYLL